MELGGLQIFIPSCKLSSLALESGGDTVETREVLEDVHCMETSDGCRPTRCDHRTRCDCSHHMRAVG